MDLASLNMARYYVEDIPSLLEIRDTLSLRPGLEATFDQLYPHNPEFAAMLERNFNGRVQDVPTWLLASAEKAKGDSAVGETITRATVKQFEEFCRYDTTYYERMHEDLKPKDMYSHSTMAEMMYKTGVVERGSLDKDGKDGNPFFSF